MIAIPAIYLLVVFGIIFSILAVIILAQLYHGYRYGKNDPVTMSVNSIFLALVIGVVTATVVLLGQVNWKARYMLTTPTINASGLEDLTPTVNDSIIDQ